MLRTSKVSKVAMVIACLAFVLCLSVGVSATDYNTEYNVTYNIGSGTTAPINVLVTIESADLGFTAIPVSLGTSGTSHKVIDALLSSAVSGAGYTFYAYNYNTSQYDLLTASDNYFSHIKYGTNFYGGTGQGYSGWQFRVNGGIPQDPSTGYGADISTTPIVDGDVIAVYVDDPISENTTTRFTRATVDDFDVNNVTVLLTESHQWYDSVFNWYHPGFTAIGNLNVSIYNDISLSSSALVDTVSASSSGVANFTNLTLGAGTYFVVVTGNMNASPAISSCITSFEL